MTVNITGIPVLPDQGDEPTFNTRMQNLFVWFATRAPGSLIEQLETLDPNDFFSVVASATDATPSLIMTNGSHGLGGTAPLLSDFNAIKVTGHWSYDATTLNRPPSLGPIGTVTYVKQATNQLTQEATDLAGRTARRGLTAGIYGAWLLPEPPGQLSHFASSTPPVGWLECNGAAISRTVYGALFSSIGSRFGAGNGTSTFNIPDLRGEFIRGWDNGRGVDSGRTLGSFQAQDFQAHAHPFTYTRMLRNLAPGASGGNGYQEYSQNANTFNTGGAETRPRNIAMLPCIRF
jgi:microcystin-dependent protein